MQRVYLYDTTCIALFQRGRSHGPRRRSKGIRCAAYDRISTTIGGAFGVTCPACECHSPTTRVVSTSHVSKTKAPRRISGEALSTSDGDLHQPSLLMPSGSTGCSAGTCSSYPVRITNPLKCRISRQTRPDSVLKWVRCSGSNHA